MKKKIDGTMILSTVLCLVPMFAAIYYYPLLPQKIPSHFDFSGAVNSYSDKFTICFIIPMAMALLNVFCHFMLNNDPKRNSMADGAKKVMKWFIPVMTLLLMSISIFTALGVKIPVSFIMSLFVGILFIILGNYLPKSRLNYTMGIKLPWTLASEDNWNKTNRLAGILFMIGGAALVLMSLFNSYSGFVFFTVIIAITVIPSVYSYILYKKGI